MAAICRYLGCLGYKGTYIIQRSHGQFGMHVYGCSVRRPTWSEHSWTPAAACTPVTWPQLPPEQRAQRPGLPLLPLLQQLLSLLQHRRGRLQRQQMRRDPWQLQQPSWQPPPRSVREQPRSPEAAARKAAPHTRCLESSCLLPKLCSSTGTDAIWTSGSVARLSDSLYGPVDQWHTSVAQIGEYRAGYRRLQDFPQECLKEGL